MLYTLIIDFELVPIHDDVGTLGHLACVNRAFANALRAQLHLIKRPSYLRRKACQRIIQTLKLSPLKFWLKGLVLWKRTLYISKSGRLVLSEGAEGYSNLTILTPNSTAPRGSFQGTIIHFILMPSHAATPRTTHHVLHSYNTLDELSIYFKQHTQAC